MENMKYKGPAVPALEGFQQKQIKSQKALQNQKLNQIMKNDSTQRLPQMRLQSIQPDDNQVIGEYLRNQRGSALSIQNTRTKGVVTKHYKPNKTLDRQRLSTKNSRNQKIDSIKRSKTPENQFIQSTLNVQLAPCLNGDLDLRPNTRAANVRSDLSFQQNMNSLSMTNFNKKGLKFIKGQQKIPQLSKNPYAPEMKSGFETSTKIARQSLYNTNFRNNHSNSLKNLPKNFDDQQNPLKTLTQEYIYDNYYPQKNQKIQQRFLSNSSNKLQPINQETQQWILLPSSANNIAKQFKKPAKIENNNPALSPYAPNSQKKQNIIDQNERFIQKQQIKLNRALANPLQIKKKKREQILKEDYNVTDEIESLIDPRFVQQTKPEKQVDSPEFPSIIDDMKPLFYFDQKKITKVPQSKTSGFETPFFNVQGPQKIVFNNNNRPPMMDLQDSSRSFDSHGGHHEPDLPKASYQEILSSGSEKEIIASSGDKPRYFSRCDSFGGGEQTGAVTEAKQIFPSFG